jgi:hypothetical protein
MKFRQAEPLKHDHQLPSMSETVDIKPNRLVLIKYKYVKYINKPCVCFVIFNPLKRSGSYIYHLL